MVFQSTGQYLLMGRDGVFINLTRGSRQDNYCFLLFVLYTTN